MLFILIFLSYNFINFLIILLNIGQLIVRIGFFSINAILLRLISIVYSIA